MRIGGKIILWSGTVFLSLIFIAWLLVFIFEKDVIKYATQKLNEQLKTEVKFESVDLTFFKTFPYASLEFKEVNCAEYYPGRKTPETLFKASYLYLQFNVWDLLSSSYSVKRITLRNAEINLFRDKKGIDNWHIWKETKIKKEKEKFSFRLSSVKLNKVHIFYKDLKSEVKADASISALFFSGNFNQDNFKLSAESDLVINELHWSDAVFITPLSIGLKSTLQVDLPKKVYTLSYCAITVNKMKTGCEGYFEQKKEGLYTDLRFSGNKLDIESVLNLIPQKYAGFRQSYDGSGSVEIAGSVKGVISEGEFPELTLTFSGEKISFQAVNENIKAKNIHFSGTFMYFPLNTDKKYEFQLNSFSGNLPSTQLSGNLSVIGFSKPRIDFVLKTRADLNELFTFIKIPALKYISGSLHADLSGSLTLPDGLELTAEDINQVSINGVAELSQVGMAIHDSPFVFEGVNGRLDFNQQDITVKELSGILAGNDFAIEGELLNLPAYIVLPKQNLTIRADLECAEMKADRFFIAGSVKNTEIPKIPLAVLPQRVSLDLNTRIKNFSYKRFEATDIRGKITLKNKVISVEKVQMKTLGGNVFLNAVADNSSEKGFAIACNGNLNDILVNDLFYRFENFGQEAITHDNLKGKLNAFVEFSGFFSPELKPDMSTLYMKCELEIENGELNKFEPLKALSGWAKISELESVRFAKLKNTIYIQNKAVLIPQMSIYSNALDIQIAGEHRFDNVAEYGFNLYLGDILANKFRLNRRPDKQGEFGELIPDKGRTRLFVRMAGPMDNLKFSYDKSAVKDKIMQDIQVEKGNVKNILDAEFGRIKNDSLLNNDPYYRQKNEKREKKKKDAAGGNDFEFE